MTKFIIQSGKYKGKTLKLPDRNITIGRELDCDVRVSDPDVSRRHCELQIRDGQLYVVDQNSQNGTFVNDKPVKTESPLHPGDHLRVGPMLFELAGKRKAIAKPANLNPDKSAPLSDDEISTWLSEETDEAEAASGDTTIIHASQLPASETTTAKPAATAYRVKKEFHSVAEEAAEIIKQHWERIAREQQESQ
ncbi:FHA domain-containing protein [Gimesia maris]|uniref:FHA domain-containing protein n=1 Tax=Gimesia maris TaxID=122 RepID=UPI00118A9E04|nr:FHA domain-containing protein [Gimesia maris]QDT77193.1 Oxoglutarate dehydrogenase inhibitor [Gimesia maris]|tara:strand:+ start:119609 stop:120187 length:579 start_codon:yes stop_codon:yes gene_type:complete